MADVSGAQLKVGDTVRVWWGRKVDTIIGLTPYQPMPDVIRECFPRGARFAKFGSGIEMTVDNDGLFVVIDRIGEAQGAA